MALEEQEWNPATNQNHGIPICLEYGGNFEQRGLCKPNIFRLVGINSSVERHVKLFRILERSLEGAQLVLYRVMRC